MQPVLIIQHEDDVAPGHFEAWLRDSGRAYQILRVDHGEPMPASAAPYAGICSLGGGMSVNDDLPWIEQEAALMRDADSRSVPLIGHCLGGQLISRALGARVTRAARKEIGWASVDVIDVTCAREWAGETAGFEVFQWHGDRFDLPAGARHFLSSSACANQAYVIERPGCAHLAMQFHIEMTPALVRHWAADPASAREIDAEVARNGTATVQAPGALLADVEQRCARMGRIARHFYDRWAQSLRP